MFPVDSRTIKTTGGVDVSVILVGVAVHWVGPVPVLQVVVDGFTNLVHIAQTGQSARFFPGFSEDGKQDSRQNGDNGDNYQELDKGETVGRKPPLWG